MEELRLGDQLVCFDREATAAAHRELSSGSPERCRCSCCRNFILQRESIYPPAFRALLDQLGIDPNQEDDVHEIGSVKDGICPYGGWFYLVGEMVEEGERMAEITKDFQCFFRGGAWSRTGPKACFGYRVLALEFTTKARWLLAEDACP